MQKMIKIKNIKGKYKKCKMKMYKYDKVKC